nr:MAG TPA: hypothetical protein [Caudoviricetes sp.]
MGIKVYIQYTIYVYKGVLKEKLVFAFTVYRRQKNG